MKLHLQNRNKVSINFSTCSAFVQIKFASQTTNLVQEHIQVTKQPKYYITTMGISLDVITGRWQGMPVAVKRFHALITTPRTIPTFQREVLTASRLHHPNIIRVCGAVMEDGIPFQIVSELLEGSVSEVIDAAHSSPCYLSHYEQLSVVVEMTSAIAYLHGLQPRPYVHADIRPKKKKIMS